MNSTTFTRRGVAAAAISVAAVAGVSGCAGARQTAARSSSPTSTPVVTSSSSAPTATGPAGAASIPIGSAGSPRGPIPAASSVKGRNASAVARAYVITAWSQDTRIDRSPNDAVRRAKRWMTPRLAAVYATPLPGAGGADWSALRAADGYTTVKVVEMPNENGGSTTRTQRFENVTVTEHDKSGAVIAEPDQFVATLTLTRPAAASPWRVKEATQQ